MSKKERLMFRFDKGALVPYGNQTVTRLREKKYRVGDVVAIEIYKPRNPEFWGLAHRLGTLCAENIDEFYGKSAHEVLKKIQFDAGIECEETVTPVPGVGELRTRKPKSLSFESMDQGEFYEVMLAMSRYVVKEFWPGMDEKQILEMSGVMIGE